MNTPGKASRGQHPAAPEQSFSGEWSSTSESPGDRDYAARIAAEQEVFAEREVVHDLPPIYHYWSHKHLRPIVESLGFVTIEEFFAQAFKRAYRGCKHSGPVRFVSVGSGNCDAEVQLAQDLLACGCEDFMIECLELNPAMLERGEAHAREVGVEGHVKGLEADFNLWEPEGRYDGVLANQALHHVVNLERLYDRIHQALTPNGLFVTSDMIGRNGHERWPEARRIVEHFWEELPRSYRFHHLLRRQEDEFLDWDCSQEGFGFEGIRAQEVLPLLIERFHFDLFLGFANVIDVFVDRGFGPNFDSNREWDREFIDRVHLRDVEGLLAGELKPTHMLAVMRTTPAPEGPRVWRHLTPEFCVRHEDPVEKLEAHNEKLKARNDRLEQELHSVKAHNERLKTRGDRLEAHNEKLKARNDRLEQELHSVKARNAKLKAHGDRLQHSLHGIKNSRTWRILNFYRRLRTKSTSSEETD